MIAGFCGETEEDHAASLDLLHQVGYEQVRKRPNLASLVRSNDTLACLI